MYLLRQWSRDVYKLSEADDENKRFITLWTSFVDFMKRVQVKLWFYILNFKNR